MSDDVLATACEAYAWPRAMAAALEGAAQKNSQEHRACQRGLKASIARLAADVEAYSQQVTAFAQLTDVSEQTEYAGQGAQLMAALEAADDRAAAVNAEEALFDMPRSEWPRAAQLQKELQPYLDLWVRPFHLVPVTTSLCLV